MLLFWVTLEHILIKTSSEGLRTVFGREINDFKGPSYFRHFGPRPSSEGLPNVGTEKGLLRTYDTRKGITLATSALAATFEPRLITQRSHYKDRFVLSRHTAWPTTGSGSK